ncbi:conserved exported hypothetical protein [Alteromonas sp. 38]|uniref:hypothetical protein n=1 Tax=Alteromonas TaxID=226 RepID=UPI0012F2EF2D|nr:MULTISPECIES: hypothetical protein [Alteromonas]CAD5287650.1 conserved exported hypothetical protein [Alteromonas sp. 154]VXB29143.1 conserved exported hypothetical protein [Alteromonas sp. 38]
MRFFSFSVAFFLSLFNSGLVNGDVINTSSITLHTDDHNLTSRINQPHSPFSASVDTAQLLVDAIGYDKPILEVSLKRSFQQIENGESVCVINKIKSAEREKKYTISLPLNFFQTQQLYQLSSLPPLAPELLNENGEIVSIHRVLEAFKASAIVLPETYSYGERVDDDLSKIDDKQIITLSNPTFFSSFTKIIAAGKADFALIFPVSLYQSFGDTKPIKMRSYAIANNPKFVSGHVICGKTPEALAFIEKVNAAIKSIYANPIFIEVHTKYLPANTRQIVEQAIHQQVANIL